MNNLYKNNGREYQRNVEKAWELFNCDIKIEKPNVSQYILDSWRRSREFQVNIGLNKAPDVLATNSLKLERNIHSELRKAALPVIKDARNILEDNQLFMLLTSAKGIILEREGDAKLLMQADSQQLIDGSNWSEKHVGTNAVGTAISLKRSVQIVAREHYCEMTNVWGCAAVPIKDLRNGEVIGVLDTTGPEHLFQSMNLGWVNSMASCIELRLSQSRDNNRLRLVEKAMSMFRQWQNDDVMVFDEDGFLVWLSDGISSNNSSLPVSLRNKVNGLQVDGMSVLQIEAGDQPSDIDCDKLEPIIINEVTLGYIYVIQENKKSSRSFGLTSNNPEAIQSSLIYGVSSTIKRLRFLADKYAKCDALVTFTGETGTGKEVISKEVHVLSGKKGNFIAVNCGAIQKDLLASELFGYAEGSFSGAKRGGMIGKFEAANNGTILLDEFCELPLDLQVYLLRVLEEKEIVRLGEFSPRSINARIIVATNKNLEEEVEAGRLREDLYYRVCANVVELPPLREHAEDIPYLFDHFIDKVAKESCGVMPKQSDEFSEALKSHKWPGNIRELRNFAENCFLMNDGELLTLAHLPARMKSKSTKKETKNSHEGTLKDIEREALVDALRLFEGNVSKTAKHLGIARSTLYKKMTLLEISI